MAQWHEVANTFFKEDDFEKDTSVCGLFSAFALLYKFSHQIKTFAGEWKFLWTCLFVGWLLNVPATG